LVLFDAEEDKLVRSIEEKGFKRWRFEDIEADDDLTLVFWEETRQAGNERT
jgi:hypothetical protein